MSAHNVYPNNQVIILLAIGFEEGTTIFCLEHMREAGLPVKLVGLSSGLITGLHGLVVRPDYSLDQLAPGIQTRLVILPDGQQCISSLLADPRVYKLFEATTQENDGLIAVMKTAEPLLTQRGILATPLAERLVLQGNTPVQEFANQLINLLSG